MPEIRFSKHLDLTNTAKWFSGWKPNNGTQYSWGIYTIYIMTVIWQYSISSKTSWTLLYRDMDYIFKDCLKVKVEYLHSLQSLNPNHWWLFRKNLTFLYFANVPKSVHTKSLALFKSYLKTLFFLKAFGKVWLIFIYLITYLYDFILLILLYLLFALSVSLLHWLVLPTWFFYLDMAYRSC